MYLYSVKKWTHMQFVSAIMGQQTFEEFTHIHKINLKIECDITD